MAVSNPPIRGASSSTFVTPNGDVAIADTPEAPIRNHVSTVSPPSPSRPVNPAAHLQLTTPAAANTLADRKAAVAYIAKLQQSIFAKYGVPTKLPGIDGPLLTPSNIGPGGSA